MNRFNRLIFYVSVRISFDRGARFMSRTEKAHANDTRIPDWSFLSVMWTRPLIFVRTGMWRVSTKGLGRVNLWVSHFSILSSPKSSKFLAYLWSIIDLYFLPQTFLKVSSKITLLWQRKLSLVIWNFTLNIFKAKELNHAMY